jgi:hypothetical protein
MEDISYSRAVFLPDIKVFFAIKQNSQKVYILDLSNLNIKYQALLIQDRVPRLSRYETEFNESYAVVDDESYMKMTIPSESSTIINVSSFFRKFLPRVKGVQSTQVSRFVIKENYVVIKE